LRKHLQTVADAQYRNAQVEQEAIRQRGIVGVHAGWAAGENDAFGRERGDFAGPGVVAHNDGVNVALTDAPRDHLGVLGPEIENDDLFGHKAI